MLEAGFDVYLTKPLTRASRLLDAVADARTRRAARVAETLLVAASQPAASPAPALAPAPALPAATAAQSGAASPGSVLIVDDNATNRMLAQRILNKLGVHCAVAADGAEAVAAARQTPHALILMDCHMPVLDGFEATAAIRAQEAPQGRRTPIVALSAGAMSEERERCLAADMDGFLAKPVVPSELVAELDRWGIAHAPVPQARRESA
jgi:CheY-like chemotaxis protein